MEETCTPHCGPIRWDNTIALIAQLSGIYGNVNRPNCPWSYALGADSGQFTAINPGQQLLHIMHDS